MRLADIPRSIIGAAALFSCIALVCGCSDSAQTSAALAPGFYRHSDNPTVYKVVTGAGPCVVGNMAQLTALGGLDAVHVIDPSTTIVPAGAPQPQCGWPAGYYRVTATNELFRLTELKGCAVKRVPPGAVELKIPARTDLQGVTVGGDCKPEP